MNYVMKSVAAVWLAFTFGSCTRQEQVYVKHLEFPQDATLEQRVNMAAHLIPTPQQLEWQQMELTAFLHFGMNTFTGREWGDGREDPALFNPSQLNAEQWVRTLKGAGFKMVIITAKHHDGFCLWPTRTTRHSVAYSPWKGGKGDVVRELRDACTKYGMHFGVYLSPWDRNASCYGDSPSYNRFFIEQLTELLTNYGEVHEIWFDGANGEGPNGKKQVYDWEAIYKVIRKLQPKAVTAIMGDDVRWVGNEQGIGRETEWSATVRTPSVYERAEENNKALGITGMSKDLGSREMLSKAKELFWYPSEVDVSIRPGWFYHKEEDEKVKSLKHLVDIYYKSVGYNSVLLLNIPPDRRGLISAADSVRLMEFAAYRNNSFMNDFITDGKTLWRAVEGSTRTYSLKPDALINTIVLQEDIAKGQRVEEFTVEALSGGNWKEVAHGTTIGYKRMFRLPDMEAEQLRVTINRTRATANVKSVSAYYAASLSEQKVQADWNNLPREGWKVTADRPLTVDLGKPVTLEAFTYAPAGGQAKPEMAFRYKFYVSMDGREWKEVPTNGEFSNIMHNPQPQTVKFETPESCRFIKLEATSPDGVQALVVPDELGVTVR